MQCYTIFYSQDGSFLIFEKRTESFFFHPDQVFGPNGNPVANGPGTFAFPGGLLNNGEADFLGCLREFTEECGRDIVFNFANNNRVWNNLRTVTIDGNPPIAIPEYHLHTVGNDYHALYLEVAYADLRQLQVLIADTNFSEADQARADIANDPNMTYADVVQQYPFAPMDDELGQVQMWHVRREVDEIRELRNNVGVTDWFFYMINELANTLLGANIPY